MNDLKPVYSLLFLILLLILGYADKSSAQIYFDTHGDSKLWLEGSSTVHRFDCVARSIQGTAWMEEPADSIPPPDTNPKSAGHSQSDLDQTRPNLHVHLKIPIRSFDCGRSRMNRDMYEALKSDQYDYITFEFEQADPLQPDESKPDSLFQDNFQSYTVSGILNVAGVERQISLITQGRVLQDSTYRIKGFKKISMPDFDIDPPTALLGMIRAHEELTVFFDLIVLNSD